MRGWRAGLSLVFLALGSAPSPPTAAATKPGADCREELQAAIVRWRSEPVEDPAVRTTLARLELACLGADPLTARFVGQVRGDLALAAGLLLEGQIDASRYLALLADRRIKLASFLDGDRFRELYAEGDRDADLVPDGVDRCEDSPPLSTTDQEGCEFDCEREDAGRSTRVSAEECRRQLPPAGTGEGLRGLLETPIPVDPGCESSPVPSASQPLGWTAALLESSFVPPATTTAVNGFKLFATRSPNTVPGCELFYEFDLRFERPGVSQSAALLFRASEDRSPDNPHLVTFILAATRTTATSAGPVGTATSSMALIPQPGGRAAARDGLLGHHDVRWRVRAVNGLGSTSGWSAFRLQSQGPDLSN